MRRKIEEHGFAFFQFPALKGLEGAGGRFFDELQLWKTEIKRVVGGVLQTRGGHSMGDLLLGDLQLEVVVNEVVLL